MGVIEDRATVRTLSAGTTRGKRSFVGAAARDMTACNVSGSFCLAGSEQTCQKKVPNAGICNKDFEIITAVCLQHDSVLDAMYPRLLAKTKGSKVIGVIYDAALAAAVNKSFCSAAPASTVGPPRLVAKGTVIILDSTTCNDSTGGCGCRCHRPNSRPASTGSGHCLTPTPPAFSRPLPQVRQALGVSGRFYGIPHFPVMPSQRGLPPQTRSREVKNDSTALV